MFHNRSSSIWEKNEFKSTHISLAARDEIINFLTRELGESFSKAPYVTLGDSEFGGKRELTINVKPANCVAMPIKMIYASQDAGGMMGVMLIKDKQTICTIMNSGYNTTQFVDLHKPKLSSEQNMTPSQPNVGHSSNQEPSMASAAVSSGSKTQSNVAVGSSSSNFFTVPKEDEKKTTDPVEKPKGPSSGN